ncbi:carboxymuconolactone decarboxylase family protein [Terrisporobacter sp.]
MKIKQTAGRDQLGDFAPKFAQLNDDVLFGEVWSDEKLSLRDRSLVTVVSLMSQGLLDESFKYHLMSAKNNGIAREEIAEIITHAAFYSGWPKAWAAFRMAKEVWNEEENSYEDEKIKHQNSMVFPIGEPNDAFKEYFVGQSYLAPLSLDQVGIFNVTFEPKCRNNWHIHHADKGGGQILICVAGRGYYQEWGKEPILLKEGDVVNIPVGVKHWHGAAKDSWFSHLAVEVPGENTSNEWCEQVSDEDYDKLK